MNPRAAPPPPPSDQPLPPRLAEMIERFTIIGRERMSDLPIYNHALDVEAVGFEPFGEGWLGVLITPWFMNLMHVPAEPQPWNMNDSGKRVRRQLPCGEVEFRLNGDEALGRFEAKSLHSPMVGFATQGLARIAALGEIAKAKMPPPAENTGRDEPEGRGSSRRDILSGKLAGEHP